MNTQENSTILQVKNVAKNFKQTDTADILVLDDVQLTLKSNEIVALIGRSGSGKSTLLRIISGLISPTAGQVLWKNEPISGPVPGISMVFQHFALLPWLTVLQNVELGLHAKSLTPSKRRERALQAIDIVGMDGFESAYPKELSGGMCQRVGFARALAVEPDVMLLDEPFSALDVLTAENLRNDLLDLWHSEKSQIKSLLLVTHNIEEAVLLADRILIFTTNPGSIYNEIAVDIPHPRQAHEAQLDDLVSYIYQQITASSDQRQLAGKQYKPISRYHRLPDVEISELTGLMETLLTPEYDHSADLSDLSESMHLDVDELFPLTEVLEILQFATVSDNQLTLSPLGHQFAQADVLDRKHLFAQQLLEHVPLAKHIRRILDSRLFHTASQERFLSELQDHLTEDAANQVLTTVIDWGRYAEIFAYNVNSGTLSLEDPK